MDLFEAVDPEAAKAKQEKREAKKLVAAEKRKEAAKNKPSKPPKNKANKEASEETNEAKEVEETNEVPTTYSWIRWLLPPTWPRPGILWDGEWIEAEFQHMEIGDEGDDELCAVMEIETGDVHHILLREKNENEEWGDYSDWDWEPLFECGGCGDNTRGHIAREACNLYRDGSTGNSMQ
jgi:hypothetical protein